MLTWRFLLSIMFLFLVIPSPSLSQGRPVGDQTEIRGSILQSNNVTTILYNYGQYSRPNTLSNVADLVWRRLGYMYEFGPLLAARVVNDRGDTLRIVDDGCWLPTQGDFSPDNAQKWGWLPRAGYARSGQPDLATSSNPGSWPASWTSWPGESGNGVVLGLNEAYYVMDDFTNREFPYYPFPLDTMKRGLGVSAEVRTYQFGGNLSDAIIIKWKLKNESPRPLNECSFGFYGDPHIGGAFDYSDDRTYVIGRNGPVGDTTRSRARNTIYCWDQDGIGMGGLVPGYLSFKFLKTPHERDLRSFWALPYTQSIPNVPKNDELFFHLISADSIDLNQELLNNPGDNICVFGTGPFSIPAGDSTYVSLAIFFSNDYQDMVDDANYIHFASHWPDIGFAYGQQGGDQAYRVHLTAPSGEINGSVPVAWQYTGSDPNAKVLVEVSSDRGTSWKPIAWDHPVNRPLTWNTTTFRDGVNYSLRIVAHNDSLTRYYYDLIDQRFTVNNVVNAQPELRLTLPFEGTTVRNPPLDISWVAEDADNSSLTVRLASGLSATGPFSEFHSGAYNAGPGHHLWDFSNAPNSPSYFLRVVVSDGNTDSALVSRSFAINQERGHYLPGAIRHVSGNSTAGFLLQVANPQQLTRHEYELTFTVAHQDSPKQVSVRDLSAGATVLSNFTFRPNISTPTFDGLKLTIADRRTNIDTLRSRFNRPVLDSVLDFRWTAFPSISQTRTPLDWFLAFNSLELLPSGKYAHPGDTVYNTSLRRVVVCPFQFRNIDSNQSGYAIVASALADSMWRPGRAFVIRPQPPTGNQVSYQINMNFTETVRPTFGDTLWVYTHKGITSRDAYRFTADSSFVTGIPTDARVREFRLFSNYPNPFNPKTSFEFRVPSSDGSASLTTRLVTLRVYDVLGREVATLVNEVKQPGTYTVQWDATGQASGVYFYRLKAGEYSQTRRMLLIK